MLAVSFTHAISSLDKIWKQQVMKRMSAPVLNWWTYPLSPRVWKKKWLFKHLILIGHINEAADHRDIRTEKWHFPVFVTKDQEAFDIMTTWGISSANEREISRHSLLWPHITLWFSKCRIVFRAITRSQACTSFITKSRADGNVDVWITGTTKEAVANFSCSGATHSNSCCVKHFETAGYNTDPASPYPSHVCATSWHPELKY